MIHVVLLLSLLFIKFIKLKFDDSVNNILTKKPAAGGRVCFPKKICCLRKILISAACAGGGRSLKNVYVIQLFELIGVEIVDDPAAVAAPDREFASIVHFKHFTIRAADIIHVQENTPVAFQKTVVAIQFPADRPEGSPVPAILTVSGPDHDILVLGDDIRDRRGPDPDQPFAGIKFQQLPGPACHPVYAVKELMHAFHNIGIPQLILADIVKTAMGLYSAPDIFPAGSDENDQRLIVEGCQAFTGFNPVYTIQMYIHDGGVVAIGGGRIEKELGAAEMVDPDFFGPGRPEQELLYAGGIVRVIIDNRNSYKRQSIHLPSVYIVTISADGVYL